MLEQYEYVIIDVAFPFVSLRPDSVQEMLGEMFTMALEGQSPTCKILILVEQMPLPGDGLFDFLDAAKSTLPMLMLSTDGVRHTGSWKPSPELCHVVRGTDEELRRDLNDRFLRRRGVFATDRSGEFLPFRYSPDFCQATLVEVLRHQFDLLGSELILCDGEESPWLQPCVEAACGQMTPRRTAKISDIWGDVPNDKQIARMRERLKEALTEPDLKLLLVLPLYKTGRHASKVLERIRTVFQGRIDVLAVLIDGKAIDSETLECIVEIEQESINVHWLLKIEQRMLSATDWRVTAAVIGGCVEDPLANWTKPSLVAMWSLFDSLDCARERPLPRERPAVKWFPKLLNMEHEDALWLAESLVRAAETRLSTPRAKILMVLPDEDSGAAPIGMALSEHLDMAVEKIGRRVIEGEEPMDERLEKRLREHASFSLVIVDESTITYGTIVNMAHMVAEVCNRQVDLAVVALEVPNPTFALGRPDYLHSVYSWTPFALQSEEDQEVEELV
jgi:hypothetical protein